MWRMENIVRLTSLVVREPTHFSLNLIVSIENKHRIIFFFAGRTGKTCNPSLFPRSWYLSIPGWRDRDAVATNQPTILCSSGHRARSKYLPLCVFVPDSVIAVIEYCCYRQQRFDFLCGCMEGWAENTTIFGHWCPATHSGGAWHQKTGMGSC